MKLTRSTSLALRCGALVGIGLIASFVSGCSRAFPVSPIAPSPGFIYSAYQAPLEYDVNDDGKGTPVDTAKTGESSVQYIGLPYYDFISVSWGDGSLDTAAEAGGMKDIQYADYDFFNVLTVYSRVTYRAYGN